MEKHQFLSSKVADEAATLIEPLPLDGSHYEAAWKILISHYDDSLKRVAKHLDALSNVNFSGPKNVERKSVS